MPPTGKQQYPVIKLALEESGDNGPFRRIVFTKKNDGFLLESLKTRAIELSTGQSNVVRMQQYDVQLTYKDSDGDSCVLLSNTDVLDALSQFSDANSVKIWCKVSNKRQSLKQAREEKKQSVATTATATSAPVVTTATQTTTPTTTVTKSSYQGGAPVPFHQLIESIVGVLATALVALQGHLGQSGMLVEPKHTNVASATTAVPMRKEDDSKPPAKTQTDNAASTAAAPALASARVAAGFPPFTDVHMGSPCAAPAEDTKPKPTETSTAPVEQQQQPEEVESRPFIHGRHTCDVCLTTPIMGGRYHATNLPDYDLCQACHSNYNGKEIAFEKVQLDRDMPFQDRWHRRYNKWGTTGRPHFRKHGPRFARGRPYHRGGGCPPPFAHAPTPPTPQPAPAPAPSAPPAPEQAKPEEVDQALKEAIRRSMADLMATTTRAPTTTTSSTTSKPASATRSASTSTKSSTKSVEQSVEEVADKVAKKMDQVALKVAESTKKVAEHVASEEFAESLDEVVSKVTEKVKMVAEKVDEVVKQHQEAVNKQNNKKSKKDDVEPRVEKVVVDADKVKEAPAVVEAAAAKPAPVVVDEDSKPEAVEDSKPAAVVEATPPAVVEATEDEIVVPLSESEATPATTEFELDAAGNGQVAADLGATMDQIVTAIRAMENELDRSSDSKEEQEAAEDSDSESFVDAQDSVQEETAAVEEEEATTTETHGATILSGEETHKDDDSHNSWMVVNDQVTTDEALARAAQVIGSALFNSDISRSASENISAMSHSNASAESSESSSSSSSASSASQVSSVDSVPTTLPSIASGGAAAPAIAQVLLDRWAIQLSQLHELGFYNDAVSVDILERLQAANVGSGEEEEVTVTQVINELMREW